MKRFELAKKIINGEVPPVKSEHSAQRPEALYYPGLSTKPFYDSSDFPWIERLQSSFDVLNEELQQCLWRREGFEPAFPAFSDVGKWASLWFYLYGHKYKANCLAFKHTMSLIDQVPRFAGWASYSALAPGSHVRSHCGVTNAKLRLHLAIRAQPGSRIRVDDKLYEWRQGEPMVFDDSFEHEVWTSGSLPRIILIIDFYHPDLTSQEIRLLRAFESKPSPLLKNDSLRHRYQRNNTFFEKHPNYSPADWVYDLAR